MTPDQVAVLNALVGLLERAGTWPLATLGLAVVVGPWVMSFILARGQERRFEAAMEMFRKNSALAENYEKICQLQDRREEDLRSIIMMNTQAMTRLTDAIQLRRRGV